MISSKILITGAGGMLGSYLVEQFREDNILTLGLKDSSDIICDLTKDCPRFGDHRINTVIHAAGTENEKLAMDLNLKGTERLLKSLENLPVQNFVYISSYKVYSRDAGENVDEETNTWATDEVGRSKALAEQMLREWCENHNTTLTVIRPARMFGNGVSGETLRLFNDALSGKYIHVRGNDAGISLVTAYDVARGIRQLYKKGGIYNAADNRNPKFIEMVEAMTANAGAKKRMSHMPAPWAEWLWRLFRWVPSISRNLAPEVVEERMKTLTLDGSRFASEAGISYHDTIAVMEHSDPLYPYSFKNEKKQPVHEV